MGQDGHPDPAFARFWCVLLIFRAFLPRFADFSCVFVALCGFFARFCHVLRIFSAFLSRFADFSCVFAAVLCVPGPIEFLAMHVTRICYVF